MKFLFIFLGLIALTSSIRLRGVVSTTPTITIASQPEYQEIPMIPTLSSQIPVKTQIGQGYYYNPYAQLNGLYGNIAGLYSMQIPSINYSQNLLTESGVRNLNSNSVATNSQTAIANTVASNGSNANTSMNNNAYSTTVNGVSVGSK